MSTAYIITYDLSSPGQNYEDVLKTIKDNNAWARLGGSSYIVLSNKSAFDIRDEIMAFMDSNDQLFVGVVSAPAGWYGLGDDVSEWIKNNLK